MNLKWKLNEISIYHSPNHQRNLRLRLDANVTLSQSLDYDKSSIGFKLVWT